MKKYKMHHASSELQRYYEIIKYLKQNENVLADIQNKITKEKSKCTK